LRAVETGARSLAFEAAGLAGPLGRVSAGLLQIAGGNALVLGAVAGLGAVALAYNLLTKESREAAEAEKKHREELLASARARALAATPQTQQIGGQTQDAAAQLRELNARRAARVQALREVLVQGQGLAAAEFAAELLQDKELADIDQARADLSAIIALNRGASARATEDEAKAAQRILETERQQRLEAMQLRALTDRNEMDFLRSFRRQTFAAPGFGGFSRDTNDPLRSGRGTTFGRGLELDPLFRGRFFGARAPEPRFVMPESQKRDWLKSGAIIATGFFQAVTALRSGGAGGAFGALGSLATAGSQVEGISTGLGKTLSTVGFVGSALGAVFSLFDHSEERRHRQLVATIERLGKEVGLERVTVVFTGPDGHQVRKALSELESSDAVERVPGPAGATG
jgi:hypothetical protein